MRNTLTRRVIPFAALAVFVAACGVPAGPSATTRPSNSHTLPSDSVLRADLPRATDTDISADELRSLIEGNTQFAFDILRDAIAGGDNVILSPHSIAAALTMTYAGARGATASEMRHTLHLGLPDARIHFGRNELNLKVTATPTVVPDEGDPLAISIANSLWGQIGYPFLDEFLAMLAESYDAGMTLVDFAKAAEQARQDINYWVELETQHRIVDLIPEDVLTELTTLVLVNAIWFKGSWLTQFNPEATEVGPFTRPDGSPVTVPLMRGSFPIDYTTGDGYRAVRIPYVGDASMIVVLPDEGRFGEVAARFGPTDLDHVRNTGSYHQVTLTLPKFEFRTDLELVPALKRLGMEEAFVAPTFDSGADFTGMTANRELYVTNVLHQAFIKVDEEGTEAAAATAVVVGRTSAGPPPVEFRADRPFLFIIEHTSTGEILFIGQVTDPS